MELNHKVSRIDQLFFSEIDDKGVEVYLLREDLIHPEISGNKWRKLAYNVEQAKQKKMPAVLTFGGAFSNHIAATAAAGRLLDIKTIGVIRGEQSGKLNPTLKKAKEDGMKLHFVSREEYKLKKERYYIEQLNEEFGPFHLIPEGGANAAGINGCIEILKGVELKADVITCACGTGSTLAGLILGSSFDQKVIGFPALKGTDTFYQDIKKQLNLYLFDEELSNEYMEKCEIETGYHFGGYAKMRKELIDFINKFFRETGIKLDGVYTAKMLYGLFDKIKKKTFEKGTIILAIHTGGVQGNKGLIERYKIDIPT